MFINNTEFSYLFAKLTRVYCPFTHDCKRKPSTIQQLHHHHCVKVHSFSSTASLQRNKTPKARLLSRRSSEKFAFQVQESTVSNHRYILSKPTLSSKNNSSQSSLKQRVDSRISNSKESYGKQRARIISQLSFFSKSTQVKRKCLSVGIDEDLFESSSHDFVKNLNDDLLEFVSISSYLKSSSIDPSFELSPIIIERFLLSNYFKFIQLEYTDKLGRKFEDLMAISDLSIPSDWYPRARERTRKIIMHVGPTNSGKTYNALKRFYEAENGLYCGPLRLLAHEIYEKCNAMDIPCNLLTGEESRVSENVNRWSSTVEMANLNRRFDVAVIDEIQMIADRDRGWAWTQAFLGIQADEIHLCGEPTVIDLIKNICELTGDSVEVKEYQRMSPLTIEKQVLKGGLKSIQPGDCVVTFSRSNVFAIKREIEEVTKHRVAVVYGALPPESRAGQAKIFNSQDGEYKVLVASDAIGMGLNLNIGRVIFDSMEKFDGNNVMPLTSSQVKQIGGRAGRFGTDFSEGRVTCLRRDDVPFLEYRMNEPPSPIKAAGLFPSFDHIERFSMLSADENIGSLLVKMAQMGKISGNFFLCNFEKLVEIANTLSEHRLTLKDRFTFMQAPINNSDSIIVNQLVQFSSSHSLGEIFPFSSIEFSNTLNDQMPGEILTNMERDHRIIILYLWLARRFPETFVDDEAALLYKTELEDKIDDHLLTLGVKRKNRRY